MPLPPIKIKVKTVRVMFPGSLTRPSPPPQSGSRWSPPPSSLGPFLRRAFLAVTCTARSVVTAAPLGCDPGSGQCWTLPSPSGAVSW